MFPLIFSGCSALDWNAKSGLQVMTSDNLSASLYLNGKLANKTPYIDKELKPGDYTVEIKPDDTTLASYETKVTLKKGLLTVISWKPGNRPETSGGVIYEMEKIGNAKDAQLSITTIPDGSIIQVDSQAKGFSPVLIEHVSPGEHEYEVSLPSYDAQKNTINVIQGFRMNISVKLAKQEYTPTPSPSPGIQSIYATDSAQLLPSPTPLLSSPAPTASSAATKKTTVPPPKVLVKPTGYKQDGQEVLRVRQEPDPGSDQIGFAPVGSEYPYLNQTTAGWYKINFNGKTGWLSGQYAQLIQ